MRWRCRVVPEVLDRLGCRLSVQPQLGKACRAEATLRDEKRWGAVLVRGNRSWLVLLLPDALVTPARRTCSDRSELQSPRERWHIARIDTLRESGDCRHP